MISKAKLPWLLCSIFSAIYCIIFFVLSAKSNHTKNDYGLLDGFCVWGIPMPTMETGCTPPKDSHTLSFVIDTIITIFVFFLQIISMKRYGRPYWLAYYGCALIIFFHGFMHFMIGKEHCLLANPTYEEGNILTLNAANKEWNILFYVIYVAMLVFADLVFAFPKMKTKSKVEMTIIFAFIICAITFPFAEKWALPALFAITHPLVSFSGLISKSPNVSTLLGWTFLGANIVGLYELTSCPQLKQIYGHVWYDVTLHISIVTALPLFSIPRDQVGEHANDEMRSMVARDTLRADAAVLVTEFQYKQQSKEGVGISAVHHEQKVSGN